MTNDLFHHTPPCLFLGADRHEGGTTLPSHRQRRTVLVVMSEGMSDAKQDKAVLQTVETISTVYD